MYGRGTCYDALEQHDKALTDYEAALAIEPDYSDLWYAKADALFNLRRTDDSIAAYRKALELQPNDAECWYDYASTVLEMGDVLEALHGFNECIRIQPMWADAYYATAKTLCAAGQPISAVPFLEKTFELDSTKREEFAIDFPLIAGPLGMEYLKHALNSTDSQGD
jgi:tetratricopeptide (TPR) repeat protein